MTGCRIGKVTLKNGTTVHPLRCISTDGRGFSALDYANKQAREGNIMMVGVAMLDKHGKVWTHFNTKDGTPWASVTGAAMALVDHVMADWNAP